MYISIAWVQCSVEWLLDEAVPRESTPAHRSPGIFMYINVLYCTNCHPENYTCAVQFAFIYILSGGNADIGATAACHSGGLDNTRRNMSCISPQTLFHTVIEAVYINYYYYVIYSIFTA